MTDDQIIDIWLGLKEYFDKKQIEAIASKYIDLLVDNGVFDQTLTLSLGHDHDLDRAIEYYLSSDEDTEYEDDYEDD